MKKQFILLPLVGLFLYVTLSSYYYGPAYGGLGNLTGATGGTNGCGGGCHGSSASSSTTVTVQLLNGTTPVTSYVPGNTYTLKISATNTSSSSLPRFGFQMCVVNALGAGTGSATYAGTMSAAPSGTHVYTGSGAQIFEHYNASFGDGSIVATTGTGGTGTTYVETITWTAPSAGTGSVIIYGILNAVNHNSASDAGDLWNTATPLTICEQPSPITGVATLCGGATTTLSDVTSGGTWSSANPSIGSVSTSGVVTGTGAGTTSISYTTSCGATGVPITVNAIPSSITGVPIVCSGGTTTLFDATPGGTWSSTSTSVATIAGAGTTATVTGVSTTGGTSLISYTLSGSGCAATATVTDNAAPGAITGTFSLCQGTSATLSDPPLAGSWTSSVPAAATIGSSTGILTGIVTGSSIPATSVITFTSLSGCQVTAVVTINPLPGPISGLIAICPGNTTTLTDPGAGSWISGSPSIATIGASSGLVTGISATGGTSLITYTLPSTGCSVTGIVTVNPAPGPVSGTLQVCPGASTSLTDGGTGTWTSASPAVATIGSSSGSATGVSPSGGTTLITYTLLVTGCSTTAALTVNPSPAPISGTLSVCEGSSTLLGESGSGTWASSAPATGSIDGTGFLTGIAPGTTTITYTLPVTSCATSATVTVNPLPIAGTITGSLNVCVGATTTLADGAGTGTWSTSNASVASIGTSGIVTGVSAGNAVISYTVTNGFGCTATATAPVTVNPAPAAISGPTHVCTGATISLTETTSGAWTSNLPGIASATSPGSSSTIAGLSSGTPTITFTLPVTGCTATTTITVNQSPGAITGPATACTGLTTTLNALPSGGAWSTTSANATVGTSGIVTGITFGTAVISYTLSYPSGTCTATRTVTVNPAPGSISGPSQVCVGSSITLTDGGGGTWTSSNSSATAGSSSGIITGASAGTSNITYTLGSGCYTTTPVTINALPSAISGPGSVCVGQTITLSDVSGTTTWSSSNSAIAAAGSGTGIVTGVASGVTNILFTLPTTGCSISHPVTVNALSAISGLSSLCAGSTTPLTDATSGGAWSSTSTFVATVGTSGIVTAVGTGTTTISYSLPSGCVATSTVNVISAPSAISGPSAICMGSPVSLTDPGGGTWTSSNPSVASVGSSSGLVTPVTTGTTSVTYSLGTGCTASVAITVNAAPPAITGSAAVCAGSTIALTDGPGGTWTSSSANATVGSTGIVSGVTAGTATISYTLGSGCYATKSITINPLPATIAGTLTLCPGSTTTLADDSTGGVWSTTSGLATVGSASGLVTGISAGTAGISYTIIATGCKAGSVVTINPNPAAIAGIATVCAGSTTAFTDAGGGTWSSSSANATVGSTGIVSGVTAGTSVISYTFPSGCFATRVATINPLPAMISGTLTVCTGSATTLADGTVGGTWSSASPSVATIGTAGAATGISAGTAIISYTLSTTGCAQAATLTVNPLPAAISGSTAICTGSTSALIDGGGGTWSSSLPGVATVGSSTGLVNAMSAGITNITYTLPDGCARTIPLTVNALPAPIGGPDSVCSGATVTLSDAGGGTWTSATPAVAAVGSATGIVSGVASGTSVITYTLGAGCTATLAVTVHASPSTVSGITSVCAGSTTSLTDGTPGGSWSSSAPTTATVGTSGIVSGILAGTASITYTAGYGCIASAIVTVNPLPAAISGSATVCPSATDTLTDAGSGTWTSSAPAVATIGSSTGVVNGLTTGTSTITYMLPTGCTTTFPITVNPAPVAGIITGPSSVCADSLATLTDTAPAGTWTSIYTSVATVSSTGVVSGLAAGVDTIRYAVTNSCGTATASKVMTINPLPLAGFITGPTSLCMGSSATLTDTSGSGSWSSSSPSVATIGAGTGIITPVAPGVATLLYSVTNGCGTIAASATDTVLALPTVGTILGTDTVCEGDTVHLGDATTGGSWSVTNTNASVDATGIVTGDVAGTDTVQYTITSSCGPATASLAINVRSHAICNSGVKAAPSTAAISVYPNPTHGVFTVDLPATSAGTTIIITDLLGSAAAGRFVSDTRAHKEQFDLSHLAPGSYFVRIQAGDATFRDKLVIW